MEFKNEVTLSGRIYADINILLDVNKQKYCYLLVSVPRESAAADGQGADIISVKFRGYNKDKEPYAEAIAKQFKKADFIEIKGAWRTESFLKKGNKVWTSFVEPKTIKKLTEASP